MSLLPDTAELVARLKRRFQEPANKSTMIAVAGGSASGKTTVANVISEYFKEKSVAIICIDLFYRDLTPDLQNEDGSVNWDDPKMIDDEHLKQSLLTLSSGKPITLNEYSYRTSSHTDKTFVVKPAEILIVEGIHAFFWPFLRDMCSLRVFVEVDADIRLIRRITRDTEERGRSIKSVMTQYVETVKPSHDEFIRPMRKHATIIIPGGVKTLNIAAIELLINHIDLSLSSRMSSPVESPRKTSPAPEDTPF
eukprot:gnl/Dysnectes_brevis/387_a429_7788.p1 GENE.gnl/Dysnectes_brevis/387_a429_7788~~gnl/Dysnectes_brevis/387_a429_7788.p1  ORF type:complete len:251 (+),score=65.26 gnl/Dysnectes_brevis/387_a429_7788:69-821(+)